MIAQNNPFNIRYSKRNQWKGQLGHTKGFVNFTCREYGIRAAAYLLMRSYRQIGIDTIRGIISRFAPNFENDTNKYITFVSNKTLIPSTYHLITPEMYYLVLQAMSVFEGNPVVYDEIVDTCKYFKIVPYNYDSFK